MVVLSFIQYIVSVSLVLLIHEFGHYYAAKAVGFRVSELSVGFGATIVERKQSGTRFIMKCFPIGGYCLVQELDENYSDKNMSLRMLSIKRIIVLISGPLANLLFASTLYFLSGNLQGVPTYKIDDDMLIQQGVTEDCILQGINGIRIFRENDIRYFIELDNVNVLSFKNPQGTRIEVDLVTNTQDISGIVFRDNVSNRLHSNMLSIWDLLNLMSNLVREIIVGESSLFGASTNPYTRFSKERFPFYYRVTLFLIITGTFSFTTFYINLLPVVMFDGFKVFRLVFPLVMNRPTGKQLTITLAIIGTILTLLILF